MTPLRRRIKRKLDPPSKLKPRQVAALANRAFRSINQPSSIAAKVVSKQRELNAFRTQYCWVCRKPYNSGYALTLLVSSKGMGERIQKSGTIACICEKCGKSPGGSISRHPLWMALRDGIKQQVAQIESSRIVLTNVNAPNISH